MLAQFKEKGLHLWYQSDVKMDKPTKYTASLFEEEFTVEALSQMGNPLECLSSLVDFEMYRAVLEDVLLVNSIYFEI